MKFLVFLCMVTGAALVYLMSEASSNNAFFQSNYIYLLYLGMGLAAGLFLLIGYQFWIIWNKVRHRVFGSILTRRLLVLSGAAGSVSSAAWQPSSCWRNMPVCFRRPSPASSSPRWATAPVRSKVRLASPPE